MSISLDRSNSFSGSDSIVGSEDSVESMTSVQEAISEVFAKHPLNKKGVSVRVISSEEIAYKALKLHDVEIIFAWTDQTDLPLTERYDRLCGVIVFLAAERTWSGEVGLADRYIELVQNKMRPIVEELALTNLKDILEIYLTHILKDPNHGISDADSYIERVLDCIIPAEYKESPAVWFKKSIQENGLVELLKKVESKPREDACQIS